MTIQKILNWTPGKRYEIVCLVGKDNSLSMSTVDYRERFCGCDEAEEEGDLRLALTSLQRFVKGLAYSLKMMNDFDDLVALAAAQLDPIPDSEKEAIQATRNRLLRNDGGDGGMIKVPSFSPTKFRNAKVAKSS